MKRKRKRKVRDLSNPALIPTLGELAAEFGISRNLLNVAKIAAGYPKTAKRLDRAKIRKVLLEDYPDLGLSWVKDGVFCPPPREDRMLATVDISDVRGELHG